MTLEDVIRRLAALGSLAYQERYVMGGTALMYVVPEDILEDVDGLQALLQRPENRRLISKLQMVALDDLFSAIAEMSGDALSAETREKGFALIRNSEAWRALRARSNKALRLFGVNPDELTAEDVARLQGIEERP
jgi:hypothetical protein